jgi:hypothetical protein
MPCKLTPIPDSTDFQGQTDEQVTLVTKDHIGSVLIAKAEYAGTALVPSGQAVSQITFKIAAGRNTLKLVCVFSASIQGVGELREDASPDSQFLRSLNGDEPFQAMRIVGA